ncbi:hypothetical protein ACS5PU_19250 [Pedobacter sp. GSP4]|uniref:hypothetical protein n=1 Tax=Pedobacter sp. GSP4 TaxID=3453716 RepID=UPI003EEB9840
MENGGDSCGKFNPEQLDRYIGKEPYSYFGFFKPSLVAAALFAFLNFPQPVLSQEVAIAKTQFQSSNKEDGTNGAYTFINGKVFDQEGTGLSNIEIELKQQNIKVKSATDGSFFIKVIKPRSKTIAELIFTSAAFEIKKYHIIVGEEKEIAVVLQHLTQVDLNEKPISDISMMLTGKIGGIYIRPTITTRVLNAFKGIFR